VNVHAPRLTVQLATTVLSWNAPPLPSPHAALLNTALPCFAGPLVVTQPQQGSSSELIDSSDEDLDDSAARQGSVTPGGSTGRSSAWRCLILDSRYLPVNVVNWGRAVVMDLSGKVRGLCELLCVSRLPVGAH
jgi:hypothetical protein